MDWVGVNFYSVPFHDNDRRRSGEHENPADELRFLYSRYAARKPIMICEYGASHRSAVDRKDRPEWAALKIAQLYASLPRLYPRVKCIDIFDNDNMRYAGYGRRLNNYSVTGSAPVLDAYREAVADDYFLSRFVSPTAPPRAPIVPLVEGASFARGILRVSAWARSHVPRPTVTYSLGGREVFRSRTPGSYSADLRLDRPGAHRLLALVLDDRGRVAARAERNIIVR